jgi:hypothetical protein
VPVEGEKLEAEFDPVLPGSEQFSLQQRRAIETAGVLSADCAFSQQSGFAIGHSPAPECAPTPTAASSMARTRTELDNGLHIDVMTIFTGFLQCQALSPWSSGPV